MEPMAAPMSAQIWLVSSSTLALSFEFGSLSLSYVPQLCNSVFLPLEKHCFVCMVFRSFWM
jgi:hypothetical protein